MTNLTKITLSAVTIALLSGCGDTTVNHGDSTVTISGDSTLSSTGTTTGNETVDTTAATPTADDLVKQAADLPQVIVSGDIDANTVLGTSGSSTLRAVSGEVTVTKDTLWILEGLVVVKSGTTLRIEAGTVIAGKEGTGDQTAYMIVEKGAKIIAEGTAELPIVFTSLGSIGNANKEVGQWGGLTIIGKAANDQVQPYEVNAEFTADKTDLADSSGVLKNLYLFNSGITMEQDKEINGLSLVGVGSGTVIEDITVDYSDDDCIESWGGTVNMKNITVSHCTDDYFDIDDGYAGTVTNLVINQDSMGNAGIEMSGDTYATFDGLKITQNGAGKEGGIYFKKDGIGGHFKNVTITDNSTDGAGTIHSVGTADINNVSFENVTLGGTSSDLRFTGDSAAALQAKFLNGAGNNADCEIPSNTTLSGDLTGCTMLTADKVWELSGLVVVTSGSTLYIEEGTTIKGQPGTGDQTSYMIVDKGAKIFAQGTVEKPIVFTSLDDTKQEWGLWGGLTIIGHAGNDQVQPYEVNSLFEADASNMEDSSGTLKYVSILNSGITMEQDKEINGLSLVGVGSGTVIEDITVDYSDDDCVESWGGTVNMTNITVSHCSDDHFDIDDGYAGTVKNLVINQNTGNAGIEMSGDTYATFDGLTITQEISNKEGGIFFKKDGVGGHFKNATIIDNSVEGAGTIHSLGAADTVNISFENVSLGGTSSDARFTGDSASDIEVIFNTGTGNAAN